MLPMFARCGGRMLALSRRRLVHAPRSYRFLSGGSVSLDAKHTSSSASSSSSAAAAAAAGEGASASASATSATAEPLSDTVDARPPHVVGEMEMGVDHHHDHEQMYDTMDMLAHGGYGGRTMDIDDDIVDCVVKVYSMVSTPYFRQPWQNNLSKEVTGSGFIIRGKQIMTNAHVVADQTYVMVRRLGHPTKHPARVVSAGHECDLAVLEVLDASFWDGCEDSHMEFGEVPNLQEEVTVVGYPIGGDNVSVTQGVVSRVEPQQYAHGASNLLAVQIDAAINPGNSGGPALKDNKVIGVAFQNLQGASNIGFIIPVPIIEHFLNDIKLNKGEYVGFCALGITCQATENRYLQSHLGVPEGSANGGILVNKVQKLSPSHNVLQKNDVIRKMDGSALASDGSVHFRLKERIAFDYLISKKYAGDTMQLDILRDGKEMTVEATMAPVPQLVPIFQYDQTPRYFIFGGLVFVPLTQPYLHEFGKNWYNTAPRELCDLALNGMPEKAGEEAVILSQVLMDDVNVGYQHMCDVQVKSVNGVDILNLKHMIEMIEKGVEEEKRSVVLEMADHRTIVLDTQKAVSEGEHILLRNRIPHDRSVQEE